MLERDYNLTFVDMETPDGAEAAIHHLHGRTIEGRRIMVEKADPARDARRWANSLGRRQR